MKLTILTLALFFLTIGTKAEVMLFRAHKSGQRIHITWSTKSISDEFTYVIQRSKDGVVFKDLNVLHTGLTSETVDFFDVDNHPPKGTVYYRIKQINSLGVEFFSDIAVIPNITKATSKSLLAQPETLVLVASSDGSEYVGKVHFNGFKPIIKAKDLEQSIPEGEYTIIATSQDIFRNFVVSIY